MTGRYIILGAGAVGGVIAGTLALAGRSTAVIARGAHREALAARGLTLRLHDGDHQLPLTVAENPTELALTAEDVVILAVKTQDTAAALETLAAAAPPDLAVVCAQNGVENERIALRWFDRIYAMCVYLPGTHLEPGVVEGAGTPFYGVLDLGRYPTGIDAVATRVATDLERAGFRSMAMSDIMRFKFAKLQLNTRNALDALCGRSEFGHDLGRRAGEEALAAFTAAGIEVATSDEQAERRGDLRTADIAGKPRSGSSSWQSLARGVRIETDYLNGEVVLLGRLHGVSTPVNQALQLLAADAALHGRAPGSTPVEEVEDLAASLAD